MCPYRSGVGAEGQSVRLTFCEAEFRGPGAHHRFDASDEDEYMDMDDEYMDCESMDDCWLDCGFPEQRRGHSTCLNDGDSFELVFPIWSTNDWRYASIAFLTTSYWTISTRLEGIIDYLLQDDPRAGRHLPPSSQA